MKKFKVHVCRIGYSFKDIEVEAKNMEVARRKALEQAPNYEFSEVDARYTVEYVHGSEKGENR